MNQNKIETEWRENKNQQSKTFNQYKLEMKRRTSVSPKKHEELLSDFHFQENVSYIVGTLRNSGIEQT